MSDEIQKGRSPNSPKFDLGQALELTKKLYEKLGRSSVNVEVALAPLGYTSLNGAAATVLGTLSQYGLVQRSGGMVQITPLALKLLHPVDAAQKAAALRETALTPKIFQEIHENRSDMGEEALANHLIHQGFTPDTAKRTASVYKLNLSIASLNDARTHAVADEKPETRTTSKAAEALPDKTKTTLELGFADLVQRPAVLATFKIPLGNSVAELIFTGSKLEPEDFVALADYVDLFKKQYIRKQEEQKKIQREIETEIANRLELEAAQRMEEEKVVSLNPPGGRKIITP